jgi:hypothetical protein
VEPAAASLNQLERVFLLAGPAPPLSLVHELLETARTTSRKGFTPSAEVRPKATS